MNAVLKVIEIMGSSETSWEDAAKKMVKEASKSVDNIRSIYIHDMSAKVEKDKITEYRINGKVSFEIER